MGKRGRKPLGDAAMTAAERTAKWKAAKKLTSVELEQPTLNLLRRARKVSGETTNVVLRQALEVFLAGFKKAKGT